MILPLKTASRSSVRALRITAAILAVFCFCQMTVFAQEPTDAAVSVTVTDGSNSVTIDTALKDVEKIVDTAGFTVGPNDRVTCDSFIPGEGGTINVDRAKVVKVENSDLTAYYVGYGTLGEIFEAEGISVEEDDEIYPLLDQPVYDGMKVTLRSIYNVIVNADNKFRTVLLSGGTVAGALERLGIVLADGDIVSLDLDQVINRDTVINIVRKDGIPAAEEGGTEAAEAPAEETTTEAASKEETTTTPETTALTTVLTTVTTTVKPTTTEAPSTTVKPTTTAAPTTTKPEVTKVSVTKGSNDRLAAINFKPGLKPVSVLTPPSTLKLDENGLPTEYKKVVEGKATAYTGGTQTASGRPTKQGHIAVDPKLYPYGTEMYIVSCDGEYIYGYCIAADTGGFVNHNIADFDLYFNTYDQCCQWGNRMVRVYVL